MPRISLPTPSQAQLQELFRYSVVEGLLYWRQRPARCVKLHQPAGNLRPEGYRYISIKARLYRSSRLVWAYHYGDPGELEIDHINRVRSDDRIENLRLATRAENNRSQNLRKDNKTGYKGVSWIEWKQQYLVQINDDTGRPIKLGWFASLNEAAAAYEKAARTYHGDFVGQLKTCSA